MTEYQDTQTADDAVCLEHGFRRECLGSFQDPSRAGIPVLHLLLLGTAARKPLGIGGPGAYFLAVGRENVDGKTPPSRNVVGTAR